MNIEGTRITSYGFKGTLRDDNGNIYIDGNFTTTKEGMTGNGVWNDKNGKKLDGEFGVRTFNGIQTLPNGSIFDGKVDLLSGKLVEGIRFHKNKNQSFDGTFGEDGRPLTGTRTYPDGTSFCCTFKDGKPFAGNYVDKNGVGIGAVANGKQVTADPPDAVAAAAARAKIDAETAREEEAAAAAAAAAKTAKIALPLKKAAAAAAAKARRSSVNHSMEQKFGQAYYNVTLSSGDARELDSASLSKEVDKAVKAGKKNKGKKKLKQKAKRLKKQLSKAKSNKKRAKLREKLNKINEKLGKGGDQASIGAPSIEISALGQTQMDAAETAAATAAQSGGDGGSSAGSGDSGGSGGS